ncbi:MAG: N-acetyltransferase [Bacteroidales bacterium]
MSVVIQKISGKKGLRDFVQFGLDHYKGNPYFVPPLIFDELGTFNREKNPVFDFCEVVHFMAYRGDKPVGRIAGIINRRSNEKFGKKEARFGWMEFTDDAEVSNALFEAVEKWAKEKGQDDLIGPMGFTDFDYEGCLVEGFDQLGTASTIYNYPYYSEHLERLGFRKDVDWVEYKIFIPEGIPDKHIRIGELVKKKYNLTVVQPTDRKKLVKEYGQQIFDLLNVAYADLYGFCELTQKQIQYYINMYLPLVRLDCVRVILDGDNKVIGFGIAIPSLSKALQESGGKLFPFGWYHMLKALRGKNDVIDLYLVGVHPDYQSKGVNALLFTELIPQFIANGYHYAESNPELEMNEKVQGQWDYFERKQHKRRRAYHKIIE